MSAGQKLGLIAGNGSFPLLLLDAAIGGFLLPARDVIVLDEAHHLAE